MKADAAGWTLIELLTVMVVLVIVAGVSVPSFMEIVERQRVDAMMQRLETDVALARHTAIARRQAVVVCPRDLAGGCRPGLDWSDGWLVFVEKTGHWGAVGEMLGLAGGGAPLTVRATRPLLRYLPDGRSAGSNLTIYLCLRGQIVLQQMVSNHGRAQRHLPEKDAPCPV